MIKFTIYGNQENLKGNPIPYHRTTQRSKWTPAHKRYEAWKRYVGDLFIVAFSSIRDKGVRSQIRERINGETKSYMKCMIFFVDKKRHADPENVRKGIQDAIYHEDKYVAGAFDFDYDPENPRVEVVIT